MGKRRKAVCWIILRRGVPWQMEHGGFWLVRYFLEHKFCTRDDRMAVVARLRDEASGTRRKGMCRIILEEGSAMANGAPGLLAGTMIFKFDVGWDDGCGFDDPGQM